MHKCTHKAAGGTIHRLKPGLAMIRPWPNSPADAVVVLMFYSPPVQPLLGPRLRPTTQSLLGNPIVS